MVYSPPLVRPPLSPLRPPAPLPFRPPGPNRLPPTQTAPIFSPPTLLPPTDRDLKGDVCIYANTPLWEPKKIRYRYPGESWQEIAGENYISQLSNIAGGDTLDTWVVDVGKAVSSSTILTYTHPFFCSGAFPAQKCDSKNTNVFEFNGRVISVKQTDSDIINNCGWFPSQVGWRGLALQINIVRSDGTNASFLIDSFDDVPIVNPGRGMYTALSHSFSIQFRKKHEATPPSFNCTFKVFDIFNQEILSITKNVCPEVIVVPERCYYKAENERLVRKVNVGFFQNLRTEYNGNCATVWLDAPPLLFSTEIYKECSDNPSCPPPRIRFNKKCEEKCEQCPPGTAIKVLLGGNIACVDSVGCVLKTVKFKPGCNNYDCICI
jgi:hypothetical protein